MASPKLPDPLARRHLLEGTLDPAKARAYGEAYLAAGREVDAIDFLSRGGDSEAIEKLEVAAVERGDAFLLRVASHARGVDPTAATWQQLANRATELGRERDADTALRMVTVGD